jgi:hypothetical protein
MGLSFDQYNSTYYFVQYGLFLIIYVFIVICVPYDLMGWMAETVLFLKDDDKQPKSSPTSTDENTNATRNKDTNECSCCCLWVPLENMETSEREYGVPCRWLCMPLDDQDEKIPTNWRFWCCIRWLFKDRKTDTGKNTNQNTNTKKNKNKGTDIPPWCTCIYIWKFFEKVFQSGCRCWNCCKCWHCCKCCKCSGCNFTSDDCDNCLINVSHCCCECDCGDGDLKTKLLPHHHPLNLHKMADTRYFGFIYLNLNRIGVYLLLCAFLWCAAVVFFEGIVLGYATVKSGDSCPTPKKGNPATVVDCFIFQNAFDTSPINKTFPTQCNSSMIMSFSGFSASCFAWIYADVEVIDVIEELGICAGIVALLGSVVAVMSYLCRQHRWRLVFDTLAASSIAAIPILLYQDGDVPFMTYILLVSFFVAIAITEYLMHYVPLLTGLCLVNRIFRCIQYRKRTTSCPVTTWNSSD